MRIRLEYAEAVIIREYKGLEGISGPDGRIDEYEHWAFGHTRAYKKTPYSTERTYQVGTIPGQFPPSL